MAKTDIVPFGKYKGQPVESLAHDREYCEWLMGQEWFRTKFVGIHTLIVNHFGDATETPEHNALQARFLDADWCLRFGIALGLDKEITRMLERYRNDCNFFVSQRDERWQPELNRAGLENIETLLNALQQWTVRFERAFEVAGFDVALKLVVQSDHSVPHFHEEYGIVKSRLGRSKDESPLQWARTYRIECKPIVGDDYPAIMRQMKASQATVLVAGAVGSSAVSVGQIRAMFNASDIEVCTVTEIENASIPSSPLFRAKSVISER